MKPKVVIIGGGFGGLTAAKSLRYADLDIVLIDKTNHHLFQPLLYQVATAALSPADIAMPLRSIFSRQKNVTVIMDEAVVINVDEKTVLLENGSMSFDYLIVAAGATPSYYSHGEWMQYAPTLKTLNDALNIREHILLSLEEAERVIAEGKDGKDIRKYITFVIVGGGPTGVELAGAIAEIAKKTMMQDFRGIDLSQTKIYLVEALPQILSTYPEQLSLKAKQDLELLGVDVLVNTKVEEINGEGVRLGNEFIKTNNIIWAAGNNASVLLQSLKVSLDRMGRVIVERDMSIPGHPDIFVIGDAACFNDAKGNPLPGIAPVAIQQGRYVARLIKERRPAKQRKKFIYIDKGNLATIGRAKAIAEIRSFRFSGYVAWLLWTFVHIYFLIGFRNRLSVMFEWMYHYITFKSAARLITKRPRM